MFVWKMRVNLIIYLIGFNDDHSNNNFEIYEKKQTRDSLMDKINNEINNIKNSKIDENNIHKDSNTNQNNNYNSISNNQIKNSNFEFDKEKNLNCDANCKCEKCLPKKPENNFQQYKTLSFKNHDQVDILVEHDKKQACCVIYNNNCSII